MNCSRLMARIAGHGVDGEHDVGRLDEDEHGEQRRRQPLGVLDGEQLLPVVVIGRRDDPPHDAEHLALGVVDLGGLVVMGDPPRGDEQEGAEDVEDPLELLDEGDAGEDEDRPEDERTEDAPEEDAELVLPGHGEVREDHRPDEDVVDRQRLLDEEAREVLPGRLAVVARRAEHVDHAGEGEPDRDPDGGLDRRLLDLDDVRRAVHEQQVDRRRASLMKPTSASQCHGSTSR